ncbi:hypothetical protein WJX73_001200 [Symbiochloris irregularis]|uniref:riboflavin kinase n=1 Tax=Symbiochloris irregularis TaxID=706552 RepID=A0AAW1P1S4_9CHLO
MQGHATGLHSTRGLLVHTCNLHLLLQQQQQHRRVAARPLAATSKGVDVITEGRMHLSHDSRVLLIGPNAQSMLQSLQGSEVQDILILQEGANDLAEPSALAASVLGNDLQPRVWSGTLANLPAYQGPFDAVIFSAGLDTRASARDQLLAAALRTKPGGRVVGLELSDAQREQHQLDAHQVKELLRDLPLRGGAFVEGSHFIFQVPPGYQLQQGPVKLWGDVAPGFGRGSRKLGTPTANLPPEPLAQEIDGLPLGVYFGWARLQAGPEHPPDDSAVHPMVMNIGRNPTVQDEGAITIELHLLHKFARDFYGSHLKAVVLGFLRPELKFGSLDELKRRINQDKGLAAAQLKTDLHMQHKDHFSLS